MRSILLPLIGLLVCIVCLILIPDTKTDAAVCWTQGTTPCSVCGDGPFCNGQACVGGLFYGIVCPTGTTEDQRAVPAATMVVACGNPVANGWSCTTIGQPLTWCQQSFPCANTCTYTFNQFTGVGTTMCDPPLGGATGSNSCGLRAAAFGPCNPGA